MEFDLSLQGKNNNYLELAQLSMIRVMAMEDLLEFEMLLVLLMSKM